MFYLGWNNDYKLKPDDVILWYSILEIKIKEWYKYKTIKCENEKKNITTIDFETRKEYRRSIYGEREENIKKLE